MSKVVSIQKNKGLSLEVLEINNFNSNGAMQIIVKPYPKKGESFTWGDVLMSKWLTLDVKYKHAKAFSLRMKKSLRIQLAGIYGEPVRDFDYGDLL
jgi:hypothetical protein